MSKIPPPLEETEQKTVVQWLRIKKILHFAPMNENKQSSSNRQQAIRIEAKAKAMGKSNGVPDLFIPIANKYYHGLFIEMKRRPKTLKSGKKSYSGIATSKDQETWIQELRQQNYEALVCYGADEAIEAIEAYMNNDMPYEEWKEIR